VFLPRLAMLGAHAPGSDRSLSQAPPPPPPASAPSRPAEEPVKDLEPKRRRRHSLWRELPVLVVLAFAIALLIKTFVLQAFFIPSASMEPTLVEGDRVLVEKMSYRFTEPKRGEVVVFERDLVGGAVPVEEDSPSALDRIRQSLRGLFGFPTGTEQDFIKRVAAVGGDEVEARDGVLYVNGRAQDEPYVFEGAETAEFGPIAVPTDSIFVLGDNRDNSDDSRNFGAIPVEEVVGRAFVVIWPPSQVGRL
jgi:signal peptidase I